MFQFRCGCGLVNHTLEDWLCHWKYDGKWIAVWNFLFTRIEFK